MSSRASISSEAPRARLWLLAAALLAASTAQAQKVSKVTGMRVYAPDGDTTGVAKQDADRRFRFCPVVQATSQVSTCLTLDARRSVDSLAGPLVFRWNLGDGQTREGAVLEYCYAKNGRYTVQLDVVDPRTGEVRTNEDSFVIDLSPITYPLAFDAPAKGKAGVPFKMRLLTDRLPACVALTTRYTWDFRDGTQSQGTEVEHTWRRPGTYLVRLSVDGTALSTECLRQQCVSREVVIEP